MKGAGRLVMQGCGCGSRRIRTKGMMIMRIIMNVDRHVPAGRARIDKKVQVYIPREKGELIKEEKQDRCEESYRRTASTSPANSIIHCRIQHHKCFIEPRICISDHSPFKYSNTSSYIPHF